MPPDPEDGDSLDDLNSGNEMVAKTPWGECIIIEAIYDALCSTY